jgi:hypothetical protein
VIIRVTNVPNLRKKARIIAKARKSENAKKDPLAFGSNSSSPFALSRFRSFALSRWNLISIGLRLGRAVLSEASGGLPIQLLALR